MQWFLLLLPAMSLIGGGGSASGELGLGGLNLTDVSAIISMLGEGGGEGGGGGSTAAGKVRRKEDRLAYNECWQIATSSYV